MTDVEQRRAPNPSPKDGVPLFVTCISILAATLGFAALLVASVSNHGTTTASAAGPSSATVHLSEFKIEPAAITVSTGGTLQIMNMGTAAHNLTIKDTELKTSDIA